MSISELGSKMFKCDICDETLVTHAEVWTGVHLYCTDDYRFLFEVDALAEMDCT